MNSSSCCEVQRRGRLRPVFRFTEAIWHFTGTQQPTPQARKNRADHGEGVVSQLAEDVGLSEPVLYDDGIVFPAFWLTSTAGKVLIAA